jgi:hypothetical protein
MNTPDRADGHAKTVARTRCLSCAILAEPAPAPWTRVVAMIIAVSLAWSRRFALDVSVRLPWAVGWTITSEGPPLVRRPLPG